MSYWTGRGSNARPLASIAMSSTLTGRSEWQQIKFKKRSTALNSQDSWREGSHQFRVNRMCQKIVGGFRQANHSAMRALNYCFQLGGNIWVRVRFTCPNAEQSRTFGKCIISFFSKFTKCSRFSDENILQ